MALTWLSVSLVLTPQACFLTKVTINNHLLALDSVLLPLKQPWLPEVDREESSHLQPRLGQERQLQPALGNLGTRVAFTLHTSPAPH